MCVCPTANHRVCLRRGRVGLGCADLGDNIATGTVTTRDYNYRLERTYPPREIITQWRETDLQFIRRILSEVGIYWRTEMDDTRELDTYIFADSQLNYRFDVRLPYSEPSGLFTARQSRSGMCGPRRQHRHRHCHHAGLQLPAGAHLPAA